MKRSPLIAALFFANLAVGSVDAQEHELRDMPGYVEFDDLASAYGEPSVMINVGGMLLKLLQVASQEDPEAAALLRDLKGVRLNVYKTGGDDGPAADQIDKVRRGLSADGWEPIVQVNEDGERVQILLKSDAERIHGLTVMALDGEEAVFINIIGSLDPAELDKVLNQFNVDVEVGP